MVVVRRLSVATFALAVLIGMFLVIAARASDSGESEGDTVEKGGFALDITSIGRDNAEEAQGGGFTAPDVSPALSPGNVPSVQLRGANVQINDPGLDNIQTFPNRRPFVNYTQSETSAVAFGQNVVVGYNSSANQTFLSQPPSLIRTAWTISGFSTSNDGGKTWTSGFVPPSPGATFTFGDPSLGVDRAGNFYYATLGADPALNTTIQVNKSTDGGRTFGPPKVLDVSNGDDKEWLAVGPNPSDLTKDNLYVTWTNFRANGSGSDLRFGRSTDGGQTWTTKTIFTPGTNPDPTFPTSFIQFSNPYVDPANGALYVPYLHFSNADSDFIQVMVSYDGGNTFSFLHFNIAGAPDSTLLPLVQPGELTDCGNGGIRLTIHGTASVPGRFGLTAYRDATRLTAQPAFAARNGILYLAWNTSDSPFFGDPASHSNIMFIRSNDGGQTWTTPLQVNPTSANDTQHVLPSLTLDNDPQSVHITYYTQHADGGVDLDMANSHDRGNTFPSSRTVRVTGVTSPLPPSNNVLSTAPFTTTNYDRSIQPCYALGEYQSVESANGRLHVAWGDTRNTVQQPVNALDPLSGVTHQQTDVFYQQVKAP
jgi:hypothetical protein